MSLTAQEIMAVMEKAKELGTQSLEVEGVKISFEKGFRPKADLPMTTEVPLNEVFKGSSVWDEMSDEELLYYATPYYDELQEKKKAHAQKLEEERLKG
jgi:hypothetical protein